LTYPSRRATAKRFPLPARWQKPTVLIGKLLWSGIVAALAAAAAVAARQLSSTLWRLVTKEEPPARR